MTGEELRAWRKDQKLTQADLALKLGRSMRHIVELEAGDDVPEIVRLALAGLDHERETSLRADLSELMKKHRL